MEELSVENSRKNTINFSLSICYMSCTRLKIMNIKNTDGNLDFLLDYFNPENPKVLPRLQIVITHNQYTMAFSSIYNNEKYAKYFKNISIVIGHLKKFF